MFSDKRRRRVGLCAVWPHSHCLYKGLRPGLCGQRRLEGRWCYVGWRELCLKRKVVVLCCRSHRRRSLCVVSATLHLAWCVVTCDDQQGKSSSLGEEKEEGVCGRLCEAVSQSKVPPVYLSAAYPPPLPRPLLASCRPQPVLGPLPSPSTTAPSSPLPAWGTGQKVAVVILVTYIAALWLGMRASAFL